MKLLNIPTETNFSQRESEHFPRLPPPIPSYEIDSHGCFCMRQCTNWWAMHFGKRLCSDLLSPPSPSLLPFLICPGKEKKKAPPVLFPAKAILKSPLDSAGALEVIANWQKKGPNCLEGAGKCRVCFWKGLGRRCLVSLSSCCWRHVWRLHQHWKKRAEKSSNSQRERERVYGGSPLSPSKDLLTIQSLSI